MEKHKKGALGERLKSAEKPAKKESQTGMKRD